MVAAVRLLPGDRSSLVQVEPRDILNDRRVMLTDAIEDWDRRTGAGALMPATSPYGFASSIAVWRLLA
jgi:hypothetical protein